VRLLVWRNWSETSFPNKYPAPLGDIPQDGALLSGSDHNKSHIGPSWGTSWTLLIYLMLSKVSKLGDNPPCKENILDSTSAQRGR